MPMLITVTITTTTIVSIRVNPDFVISVHFVLNIESQLHLCSKSISTEIDRGL